MKKKMEKECGLPGNTDFLVTSRTEKNDPVPGGLEGVVTGVEYEGRNRGISTQSAHYTMIPGSDHSQVREIAVSIGNKLDEGKY